LFSRISDILSWRMPSCTRPVCFVPRCPLKSRHTTFVGLYDVSVDGGTDLESWAKRSARTRSARRGSAIWRSAPRPHPPWDHRRKQHAAGLGSAAKRRWNCARLSTLSVRTSATRLKHNALFYWIFHNYINLITSVQRKYVIQHNLTFSSFRKAHAKKTKRNKPIIPPSRSVAPLVYKYTFPLHFNNQTAFTHTLRSTF